MFFQLLKFECKFQTRQRAFQVLCIALFIAGFSLTGMGWFQFSGENGGPIFVNGPFQIGMGHAVISMSAILLAAIFSTTGLLRDFDHNYMEITHSSPLSAITMNSVRLTGAFFATFSVLTCATFGMIAGQYSPLIASSHIGANTIGAYLVPWLSFFAVTSALTSALFSGIAMVTRKRSFVWVGAIGLFVFVSASGTLASVLGTLVDPIGFEPFNAITDNWTVTQKNTESLPFIGLLGMNRILWLGITIMFILISGKFVTSGVAIEKTT